ncbi:hypothetical protein CQW23_10185 [Capsicum baccatum]|uniref:Endonuclease/exonuclease/phosphatase domain-containing protein n=1 Tax=Capsicum baccatum TaxID=33114 RepID=A0A2G2WYW7_CAPBA|nr:hypothetical protein CQW23_10185 [Capsicum baccatum]
MDSLGPSRLRVPVRPDGILGPDSHVHSKLDKAIVNTEWIQKFTYLEAEVINPGCSNHSPIAIMLDKKRSIGGRPFKFFSILGDHDEFLSIVQQAWSERILGTNRKGVWNRMKLVKIGLKRLNTKDFNSIEDKVQMIRDKLATIQNQIRNINHFPELFEEESTLKKSLEKWNLIKESIFK